MYRACVACVLCVGLLQGLGGAAHLCACLQAPAAPAGQAGQGPIHAGKCWRCLPAPCLPSPCRTSTLCVLLLPLLQGQRANITLKALAEAFPSRPPAMIRTYLKHDCDLAMRVRGEGGGAADGGSGNGREPLRSIDAALLNYLTAFSCAAALLCCAALQTLGDTESFALKQGARPPSEAELRKKLTPGAVRWERAGAGLCGQCGSRNFSPTCHAVLSPDVTLSPAWWRPAASLQRRCARWRPATSPRSA